MLVAERQRVAVDSTRELTVAPSPEPAGSAPPTPAAKRALHFDLGGVVPLVDIDLRFDAGTHVAPVRVQGRARADQPWREVGSGVFYRLERGGEVGSSPALAVPAVVRYLRLVPDERAASLDGVAARLVVHASLASLVFAAQGEPPFRLLAGSRDAPAGALPVSAVVPQLDSERARFGRATLGAFAVDEAAAQAAEQAARQARLRPWLLWGVLIVGVAGLGALVWRLARSGPATAAGAEPADLAAAAAPPGASARKRSGAEELADRLQLVDAVADRLHDHQDRRAEDQADGAPQPAERQHADEHRERAHPAGATGPPRRQQVADDGVDRERAGADQQRLVDAVELDEADDRRAEADDDRADVGDEVGDARGDAPGRRVVEAQRVEREAGGDADDDAGARAAPAGSAGSARSPRRAPAP